MPKALTILQDDPAFPDYLDFDALRIKGREHIAKLSGKIWSDHNVHDPGITIMEVLSYAILDIGYRNQLPDEELFSRDRAAGLKENNFFTAAQILSCNPLTANDLRKLILDVNGVRNAWFEITDQSEVALGIDCQKSRLRYQELSAKNEFLPLRLNGLYRVYLELEPPHSEDLTPEKVVKTVKDILHQHRNLCEDFVQVKVLGDEEIAVCAEIELSSDANPDDTMVKVLEVIDGFLSPSITYYTLGQLLAKGKTMDEIFEGRPLKTASNCYVNAECEDDALARGEANIGCNGFIDTEELERFERIREIRVSDLYREILNIPAVRGIKKLILQSFVDGQPESGLEKWCLKISEGRRPVLSAARADFTFYKNVLPFFPNKKGVIERLKKRLGNVRKAKLQPYDLDFEPPLGLFREDLESYRSIQHDFPQVYGVGEGHLSQEVPQLRKAQALQLKGYLLFFDQLLANYLSQLANIRNLFSLESESIRPAEAKQSYFAQRLRDVPRAEELIRFYTGQSSAGEDPEIIACWSRDDESLPFSPEERDIAIADSIRAFRNGQAKFECVADEESNLYYFIAKDNSGQPFLKGKQLYETCEEAEKEAETLRFLAILDEAYRPVAQWVENRKRHTFELLYNPLDYWAYLNKILETKEEYLRRRDAFLNHLLARFSEHFTDYVLLMYALNGQSYDLEKTVQDKSSFLNHYPEISRNRGKAYNYRDCSAIWNTSNISGFERRVTAMMGIPDFHRRNLSNFQVREQTDIYYYRLFYQGIAVFISRRAYPGKGEARQALNEIYQLSKSTGNYQRIDCGCSGAYTFKLLGKNGNEAIHPGTYPSPDIRDKMIEKLAKELFLNIYEPVTTINPTVTARRPAGPYTGSGPGTNPPSAMEASPRSGPRPRLSTDPPVSPSGSDFPGSGPAAPPSGRGSAAGPAAPSTDPSGAGLPSSLVAAPYAYTGNIFVRIDDCHILDAPPAYRYRIIDEDNIYARHPGSYSAEDYEKKRKDLLKKSDAIHKQYSGLCTGEGRAVIKLKDKYYYQLAGQKAGAVLWRSSAAFQSPDEAYQAFKNDFFELIELARAKENYLKATVDGKNVILLAREKRDFPALVPAEELEHVSIKEAIRIRREHAQRFPVMREGKIFRFRLVDLDANLAVIGEGDWVGTIGYENPIDAWVGFLNCLELLPDENNWLQTGEERKGNLGLAVGEVMLEGELSYGSEHHAWEGAKDFVSHFKEEYGLQAFTDFWSDCHSNFRVVSDHYRLAAHPHFYNTPEEREVVLDCLRKNAQGREKFFELVRPQIDRVEDAANCYVYFICSESGEPLWQGYKSYRTYNDALEAYEEDHIAIMNLAREAEKYHFKKVNDKCRVVLYNEQEEIVAVIPQLFKTKGGDLRIKEIVKRIKLARQFPIKETSAGFRFDIYDFNFDRDRLLEIAWDVVGGNADEDYCPQGPETVRWPDPSPSDCGQEEKSHLMQGICRWVSGGAVLESVQAYASQEEIYSVVGWLQDHSYLFRQYDSYQPAQPDASGPFSVEWVNPAGILAASPRRFVLHSDCLKALERTKEKVNAEGLHLIEHLLLRPVTVPAGQYALKARDEESDLLLYSAAEYAGKEKADKGKASFVKYIKTAARDIGRRLEKNQVQDHEWQQKLALRDREGELIATGCRLPLNKEVFKRQIDFLQGLQEGQVESCLLADKECSEMLLEICIKPEDCAIQSAPGTIDRCGFKVEVEENIFDGYIHGADPYSFWVSVVIPFWPKHFQNTNFREFFENTIRRELPAYVAPRILWANPRDMKAFEKAYRAWLKAKSELENLKADFAIEKTKPQANDCADLQLEDPPADNTGLENAIEELELAQKALIQVLFGLSNEYPTARFQRFKAEGGSNVVLLNQTKLA